MALGGLVRRREIWAPTLWGWAAIGGGCLSVLLVFVLGIHPFLAVNHPVRGEILIVEGWLPKYGMVAAAKAFRSGGYRQLLTTGPPVAEGSYFRECFPEFGTHAEVSAAALRELGVEEGRIAAVPCPAATKDRTYVSADAVKKWLVDTGFPASAVDVFTLGPHARRTWLLYDLAIGDRVRVGIVSTRNRNYDPDRWWMSSAWSTMWLSSRRAARSARPRSKT